MGDLLAEDSVRLRDRLPEHKDVVLGGEMTSDRWTINGRTYDDTRPLTVRQGQLTRLRVVNQTMMLHPIHLQGRNFAVRNGGRARKGTILVPAM